VRSCSLVAMLTKDLSVHVAWIQYFVCSSKFNLGNFYLPNNDVWLNHFLTVYI
jgi:hypothetical protein